IAGKNNLYVIEDNAQALGADYSFSDGKVMKAGTIGHIGCTSFFPSKNLGCYGDGGALFTNNDELAERLASTVNHGMTVRYYHDHVGINSRLDTLQAAVLQVKLKYLDKYCKARQEAASFYDRAFGNHPKISIPARFALSTHVFHQYTLKLHGTDRDKLVKQLGDKGIPSAVYYPIPLHLQKAYGNLGYKPDDFPVTEELCKKVLSLSMHTELDAEQLDYITLSLLELIA
ncbi:MAG: DegT/DnrJ/EryC1/StrS family aminotransferase, partial [Bacteroidetes bacterium]|nr:DegT/DnrJ/EryC1/StrS family aminotransferase [Bacteroidota bacterium]